MNAFDPMTPYQAQQFRDVYLAFLHQRDGVPDLKTQTFSVRERFFAELDKEPVLWAGTPLVDQKVFNRNHVATKPEPGLNEATLWALATAKVNRGERYGVEYSLAHTEQERPGLADDPHAFIQVEEFYHTRILKDALKTIGVSMDVLPPGLASRTLIRGMVHLPDAYSNVLVLCGEVVGVAMFELLLAKARVLFSSQPKALERIEQLFGQILVDEVGHVQFLRSRMGPTRLTIAKRMVPMVAWGIWRDIPELEALFGRDALNERLGKSDVEAAAAPYPDRLVLPAA
jgi:hypothetical protein